MTLGIPEPRNLSEEQNLIKDHEGLDALPGYVVVVFEKLEHGGAKFAKIVNSDERFKRFFLPFLNSPEQYFAVAVNQSVLSYTFEEEAELDDDTRKFTLLFRLSFLASDPRKLAVLKGQDPLRKLTEMIVQTIRRSCGSRKWEMVKERFRELERIVLATDRPKLNHYAATLGLEIVSLELDRRLPSDAVDLDETRRTLREKKIDAIGTALTNVGRGINTPDALRDGFNVAREIGRSGGNAEKELVVCSVFAPRTARRGSSIFVQVFAHLEEDEAIAKAMAAEFDEEARPLAYKRLDYEVERHTKLVFCISIPGLQVDDPVQELIWRGRPESVQFGVRVPQDFVDNEIIGTIYVTQDSIPFGHVKFLLRIEDVEIEQAQAPTTWKRYDYAFISYASPDRPEVLKRVQMLSRLHIEFFQDLLTLEPGERWEKGIYKGIDRSDVFFLFWSTAAKNSEWVMKELRYAMNRKGADEFAAPEIVPVIIEGPPLVPPPDDLKHIHFNDRFIYFIN